MTLLISLALAMAPEQGAKKIHSAEWVKSFKVENGRMVYRADKSGNCNDRRAQVFSTDLKGKKRIKHFGGKCRKISHIIALDDGCATRSHLPQLLPADPAGTSFFMGVTTWCQ